MTIIAAGCGTQESSSVGGHRALPSFTAAKLNGGTLRSSQLQTPAVIQFFASWCTTCSSSAPALAQLQAKYPDLNYYLVAVEDTPDRARAFAKEHDWNRGELINDPDRSMQKRFALVGQPNTVFVFPDRTFTALIGPYKFEQLRDQAQAML